MENKMEALGWTLQLQLIPSALTWVLGLLMTIALTTLTWMMASLGLVINLYLLALLLRLPLRWHLRQLRLRLVLQLQQLRRRARLPHPLVLRLPSSLRRPLRALGLLLLKLSGPPSPSP
jgi:hypothetical protein